MHDTHRRGQTRNVRRHGSGKVRLGEVGKATTECGELGGRKGASVEVLVEAQSEGNEDARDDNVSQPKHRHLPFGCGID